MKTPKEYELGEMIILTEYFMVTPCIFGQLCLSVKGRQYKLTLPIAEQRALLNFLNEYVPNEESKFFVFTPDE